MTHKLKFKKIDKNEIGQIINIQIELKILEMIKFGENLLELTKIFKQR